MASISVPLDIEPCTDVCIDLTITDSAGCQVDTNIVLDVRALPSIEGLTVMEPSTTQQASPPSIHNAPSPLRTTPHLRHALVPKCLQGTPPMFSAPAAISCSRPKVRKEGVKTRLPVGQQTR